MTLAKESVISSLDSTIQFEFYKDKIEDYVIYDSRLLIRLCSKHSSSFITVNGEPINKTTTLGILETGKFSKL
jgi:hypothetical protein